jgi:hypothetical protein
MTCCNLRLALSFISFMTGNYTPMAASGRIRSSVNRLCATPRFSRSVKVA